MSWFGSLAPADSVSQAGGRSNACDRCLRMQIPSRSIHPPNAQGLPFRGPCPLPPTRDDPDGSLSRQVLATLRPSGASTAPPGYSPLPPGSSSASVAPTWLTARPAPPRSADAPPDMNFTRARHPGITDSALLQTFLDLYLRQYREYQETQYREQARSAGVPEADIEAALRAVGRANPAPAGPGIFGGGVAPPPPGGRTLQNVSIGDVAFTNARTQFSRPLSVTLTTAQLTTLINGRQQGTFQDLAFIDFSVAGRPRGDVTLRAMVHIHTAAPAQPPADAAAVRNLPGQLHEALISPAATAQQTDFRFVFNPPLPAATVNLHILVTVVCFGNDTAANAAAGVQFAQGVFSVGANVA